MPENITYRCHTCGQGWQLIQVDTYNNSRPRGCPICLTPALRKDKPKIYFNTQSGRAYADDVDCFKGIDHALVQMLYQDWLFYRKRADPTVKLPERFVDFIEDELLANLAQAEADLAEAQAAEAAKEQA